MFDVVLVNDLSIILIDLDQGRSVTNDARSVIEELDIFVSGGIGKRKVYYRDTAGRYDQLVVEEGQFERFAPCTEEQQISLAEMVAGRDQF